MVNARKILKFADVYQQQAQQQAQQTDSLLNYLWDNSPPQVAQTPVGFAPQMPHQGQNMLQPQGPRQRVVSIARSQSGQGKGDGWKKYLQGVVTHMPGQKVHWCGIFATWVFHQAGITSEKWEYGEGISRILKQTNNPKPGDVLYIDQPYQHHGIVERIDGNTVYSVDGNSPGGVVAPRKRDISEISSFYSIGPLIGESA